MVNEIISNHWLTCIQITEQRLPLCDSSCLKRDIHVQLALKIWERLPCFQTCTTNPRIAKPTNVSDSCYGLNSLVTRRKNWTQSSERNSAHHCARICRNRRKVCELSDDQLSYILTVKQRPNQHPSRKSGYPFKNASRVSRGEGVPKLHTRRAKPIQTQANPARKRYVNLAMDTR